MQQGQRVRLKSAPDITGCLTGKKEELGPMVRYEVDLGDRLEFITQGNLELIHSKPSTSQLLEKLQFGRAANLRTIISHARLTGKLADVIYSMEATNTDFYPYQFKPVLNFLESPSNGLLIADEVGLGKTIEAGLIWTELQARFDANRLLVICPAVLCDKWVMELKERFGISAKICDAKELATYLSNPVREREQGFALVASMQGIRPAKNWSEPDNDKPSALLARQLRDQATEMDLFDCVVIDEAHYMRNASTQTHELGQLVRNASTHMVLLSATPIQLKSEDLFYLLHVLDSENFKYKEAFQLALTANQPLITLADTLRRGECTPEQFIDGAQDCLDHILLMENRQLKVLIDKPPTTEELKNVEYRAALSNRIERINLLGSVINRTRKRDVIDGRVIREPIAMSVPLTPVEADFYQNVTDAVRDYCIDYEMHEGFLLTTPQRQMCSSMPAALRDWTKKQKGINKREGEWLTEDIADLDFEAWAEKLIENSEATLGPLTTYLASLSKSVADYETLKANDSKFKSLHGLLDGYWKENPSEKIIIFAFYRETLHYLKERLEEEGINSALILGGMGAKKTSVIESFRTRNDIPVLLTSEVLSEGVDLQFCAALINYDLPWNPMRVEQRIGRIDRIGQKQPLIRIWNFFYEDTLDDRIYQRLYDRLDIFKNALGGLEALLGEKVRSLTYDLLTHKLSAEQQNERIEQTAYALANVRQQEQVLEEQAPGLMAHGDYVLQRITAAHELKRYIDGENLWIYVRDYLHSAFPGTHCVRIKDSPLLVDIDLSMAAKAEFRHFIERSRAFGTNRLVTQTSGQSVRCQFSNESVANSHGKIEWINQSHPLVRFAAQGVNTDELHPVVAVTLKAGEVQSISPGIYMIAAKRWSTDGAKTIEKMVYCGMDVTNQSQLLQHDAERLINYSVQSGDEWLSATHDLQSNPVMKVYGLIEYQLEEQFMSYQETIKLENNDRIDVLISALKGKILRQIGSHQKAIETLRSKGNFRLIKAQEGAIAKLKEKYQQRTHILDSQRTVNTVPYNVCLGVIKVG